MVFASKNKWTTHKFGNLWHPSFHLSNFFFKFLVSEPSLKQFGFPKLFCTKVPNMIVRKYVLFKNKIFLVQKWPCELMRNIIDVIALAPLFSWISSGRT
jgi:hypothetical protein